MKRNLSLRAGMSATSRSWSWNLFPSSTGNTIHLSTSICSNKCVFQDLAYRKMCPGSRTRRNATCLTTWTNTFRSKSQGSAGSHMEHRINPMEDLRKLKSPKMNLNNKILLISMAPSILCSWNNTVHWVKFSELKRQAAKVTTPNLGTFWELSLTNTKTATIKT